MAKKKTSKSTRRRQGAASSKKGRAASSRRAPKRSSSAKTRRSTSSPGSFALSKERKLDLFGLLLIVVGIVTLLGLIAPGAGAGSNAWVSLLQTIFGWGYFVVPLAMIAAGVYLVMQNFGAGRPRLDAERLLGGLLLYLALLVTLHASIGASDFTTGIAEARLGRGGGVVGGVILSLLIRALGAAGTVVAIGAWVLVAVIFMAGLSLPEVLLLIWGLLRWIGMGLLKIIRKPGEPIAPSYRSVDPEPAPLERSATANPDVTPAHRPPARSGLFAPNETITPVLPSQAAGSSSNWVLPEMEAILEKGSVSQADAEFDRKRGKLIEETLEAFGAPARVVEINRGPTITQFGLEPAFLEGRGGRRTKVKVSKITALVDDLALALAARSVRIQAPVPGKGYLGVEVPNAEVSMVALRDVMEAETFTRIRSPLAIGLGKDVSGRAISADLGSMPHLLVAGTTGSGKSVCVNGIIASLLMQNTPDDLKLVMVDPKRVELTFYNGIPHLLAPVVVDLERVVPALLWVSREMDERYRSFAREGVRNLAEYNRRIGARQGKPLPYLVVVIDELADLMMMAADETERVLTRLAQLARATGIHLIIATQRPSVDVVTGLIKANFPARIAFAVASSTDSRVILDQPGAERLLGRGDMLFNPPDAPAPIRLQGSFVSESELLSLVTYWKSEIQLEVPRQPEKKPSEPQPLAAGSLQQTEMWEELESAEEGGVDTLFDEAVEIVRGMRRASISLLQRRLRIGYTRSARLVDQLEERGVIGPAKGGSKAREVLDYGGLEEDDEAES